MGRPMRLSPEQRPRLLAVENMKERVLMLHQLSFRVKRVHTDDDRFESCAQIDPEVSRGHSPHELIRELARACSSLY